MLNIGDKVIVLSGLFKDREAIVTATDERAKVARVKCGKHQFTVQFTALRNTNKAFVETCQHGVPTTQHCSACR